jgi:protein subunit release factor B
MDLTGRLSVVRFGVSEEKAEDLRQRMEALNIHEKDIEERFIRSSGKGGQKVNKTSTCVYLKHLPTGIEVKWMTERSQALNRFFARRELVNRVAKLSGQMADDEAKIKKIRKQKSKRQKRAKKKYYQTN